MTASADFSLTFKDPIDIRLPAHFTAALSIVGRQLFCARLCGEAQLTTEPYDPNLCERCRDQPGSEAADARRTSSPEASE